MRPEERQTIREALTKLRDSRAAEDEVLRLRQEAQALLQQVLEATFTVAPPQQPDPLNAGSNENQVPVDAPRSPPVPVPNNNTNATYTVHPADSPNPSQTDTVDSSISPYPYNFSASSGSPIGNGNSPACSSSVPSSASTVPSTAASRSPNNANTLLRPCLSPAGSSNSGRAFNSSRRRVTFEDLSSSPCSAESPINFSQSSVESPPMADRNFGRPATAGPGTYRRTAPVRASPMINFGQGYSDSSSSDTSYPDDLLASSGLRNFSLNSPGTRPCSAPSSGSRSSPLQEWMNSTILSQTGTGTIPGSVTFADLNSSRIESASSTSTSSTQSRVYCPHCGRSLNMNVNIQAQLNDSDSSAHNLRIRVNFDGSSSSRRSASRANCSSGSANPLGVNCPYCNRQIHLRMNIQHEHHSTDSEEEFNVQIGLLRSPDPRSPSSYEDSTNSYSLPVSTYNCGDCVPDNQGHPKPSGGKT